MTKRAFTLVELLVVGGIMAAMATVSVGSYFAVVRGMADRGALAAATSVISLAQERARIDMTPTVVYFYNELVQEQNASKATDRIVAGVAVAVRRAGRISRVNGSLLDDEYADLERTYGIADSAGAESDTFRLYHFNFSNMEYSSVYSEAVEDEISNEKYLVEKPKDRGFKKPLSSESEDSAKMLTYAFRIKSGFSGWRAGYAYGYEFARIRLPDNYIFGSDLPDENNPVKSVGTVIKCYPDSNASTLDTVQVYTRRASGWKKVGDTKSEMKDI